MAKIEEALKRNFDRKYVCLICKSAIRVDPLEVSQGKAKCRKCGSKKLRAPRKK